MFNKIDLADVEELKNSWETHNAIAISAINRHSLKYLTQRNSPNCRAALSRVSTSFRNVFEAVKQNEHSIRLRATPVIVEDSGQRSPIRQKQTTEVKSLMGIYSKYIFPRLLDWSLGNPQMGKYRRLALEPAQGETLEIGFGTGLNLPYYPQTVTRLTVIDSENMLTELVDRRIAECSLPVTKMQLDAQGRLPFEDHSFDSVVTTLTLCSIENTTPAMAEIRRVLKPGGRFVFWEHGRSDDPTAARWQDRLNPLQRIIGAGCNMNRKIDDLISTTGFEITKLDRFLMPKTPRLLGEMYRGIAEPQA